MKKKSFKKAMAFVLSAMLTCGVVYAAPENLLTANADELGGGTQQSEDAGELTPAGEGASGAAIDGDVKLMQDPQSSAADESIFTYTEWSGKIKITGLTTSAISIVTDLVIPATIDGKPVTAIGREAFYDCTQIKSVSIPNSVTKIEHGAFRNCTSLQSITIPEGVTTIDSYAFYGCSSLGSITIPDGVTTIDSYTFYGCSSLGSVTIPDSVTTIGSYAFRSCTSLQSITIPDDVTTIGSSAFDGCSSLGSVTIPDSVTTIGSSAFSKTRLVNVESLGSITEISEGMFANCTSLEAISIRDGVTTIGSSAFNGCSSLGSVTIPDSVTTIGSGAFRSCTSLQSITIPDDVTTIGSRAFDGCSSLGSVTIPDSVTTIGSSAFSKTRLVNVESLGSITEISEGMFENCTSLEAISIRDGVTTIGSSVFNGCSSLGSVTIPDGVTTIGSSAFRSCTSLTNITIPDSVTTIGDGAFSTCTSLVNVESLGNITEIGHGLFAFCTSLEAISIPDGVTKIGYNAFINCKSLKSIVMPNTITEVGESLFYECYNLEEAKLSNGLTEISDHMFFSCSSLKDVVIPSGVKTITSCAFEHCRSLENIVIPDGVTEIGYEAFGGCGNLVSVKIPNSVKTISQGAFESCGNLKSVTIPSSVESIGIIAFRSLYQPSDVCIWKEKDSIAGSPWGAGSKTKIHWLGIQVSYDYKTESLTDFESGEIKYTIDGNDVTPTNGKLAIDEDWFGKTLSITKSFPDGESGTQELAIPDRPAAPTGLTTTNVSAKGQKDGKITGAADTEYRLSGETTWKQCSTDTISDLAAGTYEVRKCATDNSFASKIATVVIAEPDALGIDYDKLQITGLDPGSTYIINGETVTPSKDGTLDIDKAWYGKEITIEKTAKGSSASITEKITIPKKADMPTGIGVVNASGKDKADGKITGVSDQMEYRLVPEEDGAAITWKDCTGDTVTGLAPGKYEVRIKAINGESFAGDPVKVEIGIAKHDALSVDYDKAQIVGFDPNSTYTINGTIVTPSKDGTLDIDKSWYGTEITIEKTAKGASASITEKITIPKKSDMPTGVSTVNASGKDKADGKITGVSDKMEYRLVPEEDGAAITWKDCTGDTVTGLAPGKYEVRIKAINGESFASDPVEVTIGVTEPDTSGDSSKGDKDTTSGDSSKGDKDTTSGGSSSGSGTSGGSSSGSDKDSTSGGSSSGGSSSGGSSKGDKDSTSGGSSSGGSSSGGSSKGDKDSTSGGSSSGGSSSGGSSKDDKDSTSGGSSSGSGTNSGTSTDGTGTTGGTTGCTTTPVTPVTPDPTTPVTPDPATPTTPDQGGTGSGTTDQGTSSGTGGSGSSSGGSTIAGGSGSGSGSGNSSSSHRHDSSSSSSNKNNSSNSNKNNSATNSGTTTTTSGIAANGQNGAGNATDGQNGSASGNTTATITNGSGISQTVKDNLSNALESILDLDSNIQTGPYVQSDSDDIKVEIPSDLQKSGRTFYLMTAKDNGDIVILSNESSEDGVFEATGEAGTDYMMIFEDGETPLASMIADDGTLDTTAAEADCYNHLIGLGLALIGLLAAALLARKGNRYFWAASAAGLALALAATATGSCSLDWIFFAAEAIITVAATAALWMKQKKVTEQ